MNTDDLYEALSTRISTEILASKEHSVRYFDAIRTVVHRVVNIADKSCLSGNEKTRLVQRLMEHVSSLEACLPK